MPQPNVIILRAPGTNCDMETAFAFEQARAKTETLHINRLLENPSLFQRFQILCIPGGFSYGDDIAAGRILGNQIQHHLDEALAEFKEAGKLMLGICNGFQILMKSPVLLPPDPQTGPRATLTLNDSGRYEDRWVRLKVQSDRCVFLREINEMYLPVAHAEGKFVTRDEKVLNELIAGGQTALRYVPQNGESRESKVESRCTFPDNPNGSVYDIAGVCDATGRVFGLMPHPERHIDPTQHPRWTRGEGGTVGDGLQIFVNAVKYFS
jgi:phosphoribosylformylglycinamidine synthase subunit PurQ / glutaminase